MAVTFSYTPPGGIFTSAAQVKAAERMTWTPPHGHDFYCAMQTPPSWRLRHVGDTAMAAKSCTCSKNALAKLLRSARSR